MVSSIVFGRLSKEDQDIIRQIDFYCYDQQGCRMLQKRLEEDVPNKDFKRALIQGVTPFFNELMLDQFGNYLSQKIFEEATEEELKGLVATIQPTLVDISTNVHGTRAVQTLIEVLSKNTKKTEQLLLSIIQYLRPQIRDLSLNAHGNHVI